MQLNLRSILYYFLEFLFVYFVLQLFETGKMAGKAHQPRNVMKKPLGFFSKELMTGFYRNGFCDVGPEDTGNHSVASTALPSLSLSIPLLSSFSRLDHPR